MNFYKHHIGDFAQATAHLTFVEDAAYSRLLRKYYAEEKPIPGDLKKAQRLVGARTREEKEAVQTVLEEFFQFDDEAGVWRNKRADEEIDVAQTCEDEADERKANERERQRRHRERRKVLFSELRLVDVVPKWDTSTEKLEVMLSRVTGATGHGNNNATKRVTGATGHAPATANQKPEARSQYQEQELLTPSSSREPPATGPERTADDDPPVPGEQDLPSWVPKPLWREFYRHRAVIRKPLSIPGQRQVVQRLVELSQQGHDVASSLRQTMAAGLAIPVTPKDSDHGNHQTGRKLSVVERVEKNIADRREREQRDAGRVVNGTVTVIDP